jgi:hypothetical protein
MPVSRRWRLLQKQDEQNREIKRKQKEGAKS